jgi:hypothetical protein
VLVSGQVAPHDDQVHLAFVLLDEVADGLPLLVDDPEAQRALPPERELGVQRDQPIVALGAGQATWPCARAPAMGLAIGAVAAGVLGVSAALRVRAVGIGGTAGQGGRTEHRNEKCRKGEKTNGAAHDSRSAL